MLEDPRSIVLVTNPTSGRARQRLAEVDTYLAREGVRVLETIPIKQLHRLRRWVERADGDRPMVVAAGGDGTVGSVAGYLVNTESVLAIVPVGTSNDIARTLDVPLKVEDAVRLLARGQSSRIDVGCFRADGTPPRYFLHAATAGVNVAFARMATQPSFRKRLGKFTYLVAAVAALRKLEPFSCDLVIDGRRTALQLIQICVVNAPVFGGLLHLQLPDSSLDDHRLDVLTIEDMNLWRTLLTAAQLVLRRPAPVSGIRLYHVQELAADVHRPLSVTLDGEIAGTIPGHFSLCADALRVIRREQH